MTDYSDWNSFLNAVDKDIETSFEKISQIAVEIWKREVEDRFYGAYSPVEYDRNYQTLDSIRVIKISKNTTGYFEIEIGYDISLITTSNYTGKRSGLERERHSNPELQPYFVEYGFDGYGVDREGSHAFEYMLGYVKSDDFKSLLSNELRKLGYVLK